MPIVDEPKEPKTVRVITDGGSHAMKGEILTVRSWPDPSYEMTYYQINRNGIWTDKSIKISNTELVNIEDIDNTSKSEFNFTLIAVGN